LLAADEAGQWLAERGKWGCRVACLLSSTQEQCCSGRIVQSQGFNQTLNCLRMREAAHASLEVRDAACAQSGSLRQRLLRQASGESVAPE